MLEFFSEKENTLLVLFPLLFTIAFIAFFPGFYSSIDEHSYYKNALLLQGGSLAVEEPELACRSGTLTAGGYTAPQFIGRSAFLVPFTWLGLQGAMLSGLAVHLINFAILFLLFRKLKVHCRYSLLLLFYPAMAWASRTLYAAPLVLTAMLTGLYFYVSGDRKHWLLAGVFFGLAVFSRYDAAIAVGAFAVATLFSKRERFVPLLAGFAPVFFLLMLFNALVYGSALSTGYGSAAGVIGLLFHFNPAGVLVVLAVLLCVFPGMLLAPFVLGRKPLFFEFVLLFLSYFVYLASVTYVFSLDFSVASMLTSRMRYFIPLIGLLLVPYGMLLQRVFTRFKARETLLVAGYYAFIAVMLFGTVYAFSLHSAFLDGRMAVLGQINENIPDNALVIGSSDDCMYFLQGITGNRRYLNIDLNQGLAGNPQSLEIESFLRENTYVLSLSYSNREERETARQQRIENERARILEFIEEHSNELEEVFSAEEPHRITIYRYKK